MNTVIKVYAFNKSYTKELSDTSADETKNQVFDKTNMMVNSGTHVQIREVFDKTSM